MHLCPQINGQNYVTTWTCANWSSYTMFLFIKLRNPQKHRENIQTPDFDCHNLGIKPKTSWTWDQNSISCMILKCVWGFVPVQEKHDDSEFAGLSSVPMGRDRLVIVVLQQSVHYKIMTLGCGQSWTCSYWSTKISEPGHRIVCTHVSRWCSDLMFS